jgi:hypothetical protein
VEGGKGSALSHRTERFPNSPTREGSLFSRQSKEDNGSTKSIPLFSVDVKFIFLFVLRIF